MTMLCLHIYSDQKSHPTLLNIYFCCVTKVAVNCNEIMGLFIYILFIMNIYSIEQMRQVDSSGSVSCIWKYLVQI